MSEAEEKSDFNENKPEKGGPRWIREEPVSDIDALSKGVDEEETGGKNKQQAGEDIPRIKRKPRSKGEFKLGIIGGVGAGKTSYLYVLGKLKYYSKAPLGEWKIGGVSPEYQRFYARIDDEDNRRIYQRTTLRDFDIFDMFPVFKKKLKVSLRAFDAAGENFEAAVNPRKFEEIEEGTETYRVVRVLQKEILDCDGFIFLVDCELAEPMFKNEVREERPEALLPHQLLFHLHSFLYQNGHTHRGKISKPIAFVLNKADTVLKEKDCPLNSFKEVLNGRPGAKDEGVGRRMKEAKDFVRNRFVELYNLSADFLDRSFHAISCWGHEPVYYYFSDPKNKNSMEMISREELKYYTQKGHQPNVWVKDIHPVCVEEPLLWILSRIEAYAKQQRRKGRTKVYLSTAAVLLLLAVYPFISYLAGDRYLKDEQPSKADFMYSVSEEHPFFKTELLQVSLAKRYFDIVDAYLERGEKEPASKLLDKMKTMTSNGLTGIEGHPNPSDDIVYRWIRLTEVYINEKKLERSYESLKQTLAMETKSPTVRREKFEMAINASELYNNQNMFERSVGLMRPLFISTLSESDFDPDMKVKIASTAGKCINLYSDQLIKIKEFSQAREHLLFLHNNAHALMQNPGKVRKDIFKMELLRAGDVLAKGETASGKDALRSALKWMPAYDDNLHSKYLQLVKNSQQQLGFGYVYELMQNLVSEVQLSDTDIEAKRQILFQYVDTSLRENNESEALSRAKRIVSIFRDARVQQQISSRLAKYALGLRKDFARLAFISGAKREMGRTTALLDVEKQVVLEMAYLKIASGQPKQAIALLDRHRWMNNLKKYKRYRKYAIIATGMAFIPGHSSVESFYIDRHEVCNRDYEKIMTQHSHLRPVHWGQHEYNLYSPGPEHPVIRITWMQAREYANRIGKRLPTAKEWELAWGDKRYPWGHSFDREKTNTRELREGRTLAHADNAIRSDISSHGVYALLGNVKEYTSDTMLDESGSRRAVVKGGAFIYKGRELKKSKNSRYKTDLQLEHVGFRCSMDILKR